MTATAIPTYDPTLFQGAAPYYVRYRSRYPQTLFDQLTEIFQLDGTGRLLDLGAGTGVVAIPFSDRFSEVVAIDPDPAMLAEGKAEAKAKNITNIRWVEDIAESISPDLGKFQLATFGRSFHWTQRELVLEKLYPLLTDDGGVAILATGDDPWNSELPWKKTAIAVVKRWLGEERRTGKAGEGKWQPLPVPHTEVIAKSRFARQERFEFTFPKDWTVDSYLGYIYSTAFGLPSFFGENRDNFEKNLRASLLEVEPSGTFTEQLSASALVAWKH